MKMRRPVVVIVLMVMWTVTVCVWAYLTRSPSLSLLVVPVLPFTPLRLGKASLDEIRPSRPAAGERRAE